MTGICLGVSAPSAALPFSPSEATRNFRESTLVTVRTTGVSSSAVIHSTAEKVTLDSPKWMQPLVRRLAVCETHGNPRHHWGANEGMVGWYHGTWLLDKPVGAPQFAYEAPIGVQYQAALTSLRRHRYFGCLNNKWVRG
jgi:hypothetical protein